LLAAPGARGQAAHRIGHERRFWALVVAESLIHTAELNGDQPFDHLFALQRNQALVEENPKEWMPWNHRATPDEMRT
jgi:hypothetical protein